MKAWTALTLALLPGLEDEILSALQEAGSLGVAILQTDPGEGILGSADLGARVPRTPSRRAMSVPGSSLGAPARRTPLAPP